MIDLFAIFAEGYLKINGGCLQSLEHSWTKQPVGTAMHMRGRLSTLFNTHVVTIIEYTPTL